MKYIVLLLSLTACGSESATLLTETPNNPGTENVDTDDEVESDSPGIDPVENAAYTNTYGSNFCNSTGSDLDCWGSIVFMTGHSVQKLMMGRDAICYAQNGFSAGVKCYSASLGPIEMNGNVMRGSPLSTTTVGFINVTVNTSGQICFKIATYNSSNQIHALYNVCGFTPTANGGLN